MLEYASWRNVFKIGHKFTGMDSHVLNSFNGKMLDCMKRWTEFLMICFGMYGS
jgi:hypothetical protein